MSATSAAARAHSFPRQAQEEQEEAAAARSVGRLASSPHGWRVALQKYLLLQEVQAWVRSSLWITGLYNLILYRSCNEGAVAQSMAQSTATKESDEMIGVRANRDRRERDTTHLASLSRNQSSGINWRWPRRSGCGRKAAGRVTRRRHQHRHHWSYQTR